MKIFRLLVSSLAFTLIFTTLVIAQTEKTQIVPPSKIAVIDSNLFYDKTNGVKELTEAYDKLEAEFKPQAEELELLAEKILKLQKTLEEFQILAKKYPNVGCYSFDDKFDEYDKLTLECKQKQTETRTLYQKRELEQIGDIKKKIGEAIQKFTKEKGYAIILDSSKINDGLITDVDDVTKEFIKYYNENFAKAKI
jgi:Skp family chaperone for outer membrane proteins